MAVFVYYDGGTLSTRKIRMNSPDSKFHSVLNSQCRCFYVFESVKGHCSVYYLCINHRLFLFTLVFVYAGPSNSLVKIFLKIWCSLDTWGREQQ